MIRQRSYSRTFPALVPDRRIHVQVYVPAYVADASAGKQTLDASLRDVEPEVAVRGHLKKQEAPVCVINIVAPTDEAFSASVRVGEAVVEFSVVEKHPETRL